LWETPWVPLAVSSPQVNVRKKQQEGGAERAAVVENTGGKKATYSVLHMYY